MFLVRGFVLTMFGLMMLFFGRLHAYLPECNGLTTFLNSSQNGSISSFEYDYYYNQSCSWLITAPIGQRVLIYFTTFDARSCYNCDCNSVIINDGRESWSPRLARLCGKNLPGLVYYSSGRYIRITFQPKDSEYVYQEFQVQYLTLFHHSSSCSPVVSGASAGVIYSPNFPWYHPNNKSCYWQITVPRQQKINLHFTFIYYKEEECRSYVEILDIYSDSVIRTFWLCDTLTQPSVTYSGSIGVRFYPGYRATSSVLVFYQIRSDDFPFPYTTYATNWPEATQSTNPVSACKPVSSVFVESSGSTSIKSSAARSYRYTLVPNTKCTWEIETTKGYTVQLMFDDMAIRRCSDCSCGYVRVRDGSGLSAQSRGTFCNDNYPRVVSSTGSYMFIEFYAQDSFDFFKATIRSTESEAYRQRVPAIVVPIVVGIVLFAVMVIVIKCTKIRRSTVSGRPDQGNTMQTEQRDTSQVVILYEPDDGDEEMIDVTRDNNTASGTSETV